MNAFTEAFVAAMRLGCAVAGAATCAVMLMAAGTVLRDGHYIGGIIFTVGSLWLFRYSGARAWALLTNKQEVE